MAADISHKITEFYKRINEFASLLWRYDDRGYVSVSSEGSHIAIGSHSDVCFLNTKKRLLGSDKTNGSIKSISISSDGIYTAISFSKKVRFYKERRLWWEHEVDHDVKTVSVSPDGSYSAIGSSNIVYLLNIKDKKTLGSYETDSSVHHVAVSSGGYYTAVGSKYNVYFLSKENFFKKEKNRQWTFNIPDGYIVKGVSLSSDGSFIAISFSNKVCLFNKDRELLNEIKIDYDNIESVSISSDGSYIGVGSTNNVYFFNKENNKLYFWDFETDSKVKSLSVSPDGSYIAAGSNRYIYVFKFDVERSKAEEEKIKNLMKFNIDPVAIKKAIQDAPEEAEKFTETFLRNNFDPVTATKLVNPFRIIIKTLKNCSFQKIEEKENNLTQLREALKSAGVGERIIRMVNDQLDIMRSAEITGASVERISMFCENLVELWFIDITDRLPFKSNDTASTFNLYDQSRVNIGSIDKSTNISITGDLPTDLESLRVLVERDYKGRDKSELVKTVNQMKQSCGDPSKKNWLKNKLGWIVTRTSEVASISSFAIALINLL